MDHTDPAASPRPRAATASRERATGVAPAQASTPSTLRHHDGASPGSPGAPGDAAPAQALAERVRDTMARNDAASRALGIEVIAVAPGAASVAMTVRADMLNGFAICHGGLIATLADTAFAYACNSWNQMTVASGFDVQLLAAAREGDRLTAHGAVASQGARMGVYDIEVHNQSGERVALFRGRSYRLHGKPVVE